MNEEWEEKVEKLKVQHEREIESLAKVNLDKERKLSVKEIEKSTEVPSEDLNDAVTENLNSNSKAQETVEINKNCQQAIDKELAHQSTTFQEQLQNTIKNLEVNDRDRMEEMRNQCLQAMETQKHLMACRQITEMMQLLAMQRKQNQRLMKIDVKNEKESIIGEASAMGGNSQHNQSKSLKHLWEEFLGRVDNVHNAQLDSDERKILNKIQQIRSELSAEIGGDESDEMFIISEPNDRKQETNLDWLHRNANDDDAREISNRPLVEWERSTDIEMPAGSLFTSPLFDHISHPRRRTSSIPKIATSIMKMARDESKLERESSQDAIMKKLLIHSSTADVDVVPLPRTEAVSIRDSKDVIEQRRVS